MFFSRFSRHASLVVVAALIAAAAGVGFGVTSTAAAVTQSPNCGTTIGLRNGDFETPRVRANFYAEVDVNTPGLVWRNTAENIVEMWNTPFSGVNAYSGSQIAELNALLPGTLYQDAATVPGSTMVWRIAHKATERNGESMWVRIGEPGSNLAYRSPRLTANLIGPDRNGWTVHSGSYTVPAGQTTTRFAFESDGTTTANPSTGNLLDDIEFSLTAGACSDTVATNAGSAVTIDVLGNDVGAGLGLVSIDANSGGTATIVGNRVQFTPTAGFSGTASFTYTMRDIAGNTSSATSTVNVLPIGVADAANTTEATPITISALANDLGSAKTITGVTTPAHGSAFAINARSAISYTPVAGFVGTDTFTYRASANGGTYEATVTVTVTASADLSIVFGFVTTSPLAGTEISVPVVVSNNGPSTAGGTATISLPVGLSFVSSAECTAVARVVTCPVPSMTAYGFTSFRLLVHATVDGTHTINGQVTGPIADPNALNNVSSRSIVVRPAADLSVAGSVSPAPLVPGTSSTWSFVTSNNGPSSAAGSQVVITVDPSKLDAPRTAPGNCTESPAGTFTCSLDSISSGASATTTISGVVNAGVSATMFATAVVSTSTTDPNSGSNADVVSDVTNPTADLSVEASAVTPSVDPGGIATFGFKVTNLGPSVAHGVLLDIPIPANYEITGVPDSCTVNGTSSIQCGIGFLDVTGGSFSDNSGDLVITGVVRTDSGASLALTGTASMNPSVTDPVAANNSATATSSVDVRADLAVVTALSQSSPVPGLATDLYVSASNDGPSTAGAPVVTITVPAGFAPMTSDDSACVLTSTTVMTCTLGDLIPGATHGIVISGAFAAAATGVQTFTTTIASSSFDPELANNTSTLAPTLQPQTDLEISGLQSPTEFAGSGSGTYAITITNRGPSTAIDMTVTITLDPDLTAEASPDCSGTTVVTCTVAGPIAPGENSGIVAIPVTVSPVPTPPISTTASVTSAAFDPDLTNNTVTIEGSTSPQLADIAVTAAFGTAEVVPGGSGSAVFNIINNGPAPTTITPIRLTMPEGFTLTDVNNGGACNPTADSSQAVCDLGPILAGETQQLVATFDVSSGISAPPTPSVIAEAIDSMSPDTAAPPVLVDSNSANNAASIDYTLAPFADLAITGTAPELFAAGPGTAWQFTVDNLGPSTTGSIALQLTVPPGAVFTRTSGSYPGHGADPTFSGSITCDATLICDLPMLLIKGESIDVTVILDTTGVAEGAVSLIGEVSSPVADPDPSNNSVTLTSGAVTTPVDPVDPGTSGELPYTGNTSTGPLLAGGALLAGVGLLLLGTSTLAVRKRRRA
jgi:uncharacterized repeat protein (TIGR01451 family)